MSVSGIGGSTAGGISQEVLEQLRAARQQGMGVRDTANYLVEQNDGDGDGLLSLKESGFSEEMFNRIDADGDSYLSADEISEDMQARMDEMRQMKGAMNMLMGLGDDAETLENVMGPPPPPDGAGESEGAGGSGGAAEAEESDEEYDEYDLNEDGVVSLEEMMIAFQSGASEWSSLFGDSESESSGGASSYFQNLAMRAYSQNSL